MICKIISSTESKEGKVTMYENTMKDGSITYTVCKTSTSFSKCKHISGLKYLTALKRYSNYCNELAKEYFNKCIKY